MNAIIKTVVVATAIGLVGCAATTAPQQKETGATMANSTPAPSAPAQVAASTPLDLQAQVWTLAKIEGPVQPQSQAWGQAAVAKLQLNFIDGQSVVVKGLCNTLHGSYQAQEARLQVTPLAATMMACADAGVMAAEDHVRMALPLAQSWRVLQGHTLEIAFADGQRWVLEGQVKPEVVYGKPERIFLEVAPQKQACPHPLMADAQCLQVRSLEFNAQGLKQNVGPWENFFDTIQGFEHRAGERNVLRLKRFTNPNPPADASRYVYVLDMVVETEVQR